MAQRPRQAASGNDLCSLLRRIEVDQQLHARSVRSVLETTRFQEMCCENSQAFRGPEMNASATQADEANSQAGGRVTRMSTIFFAAVMGFAVVGYLIGIEDGVPQADGASASSLVVENEPVQAGADGASAPIATVSYAEMPSTTVGRTADGPTSLGQLPQPAYDLFAEIVLSSKDKQQSAAIRASRRAFNGAPPIIPHAIEGTSDSACYLCHANGMAVGPLRASAMSHGFLANCTQCHVSPAPPQLQAYESQVETTFVGLPAPLAGKRAFPGAPPTIPHSQWMRSNCNACHGGPNGWAGMESNHPWRTNCTQCHAPSAALDQGIVATTLPMLPPIEVEGR